MENELTGEDIAYLLECLSYTRLAYESTEYPNYETKQMQLKRVTDVERKLRAMRSKVGD